MNTKPLPLLVLTFTLIACNAGAPPSTSPRPATPMPATPSPGAPTPGTPAPTARVPGTSQPADPATALLGRNFVSVSVTVDDEPLALAPNTVIRIGFQDGQISASAGCNLFGGTYHIDGTRLVVDGGGMTEMGCDDARHAQDDWLFGLLGADPIFALAGDTLVLKSADAATVITLRDREVVEPDAPLVGTTWRLTSIITGDAVSSVPEQIQATIRFTADGRIELRPGCNTGGGSYAVDGDTITFSDLILTEMACLGPGSDVEAAVLSVLSGGSVTYSIDSGSLTLMAGNLGLGFSAS